MNENDKIDGMNMTAMEAAKKLTVSNAVLAEVSITVVDWFADYGTRGHRISDVNPHDLLAAMRKRCVDEGILPKA